MQFDSTVGRKFRKEYFRKYLIPCRLIFSNYGQTEGRIGLGLVASDSNDRYNMQDC